MLSAIRIPTPNRKEVTRYLDKWDRLPNYTAQERSLKKLFVQTYPKNSRLDDVLIKVCSLNDFYSTNIFSPFAVAKHIIDLEIDSDLSKSDLKIVNKLALVKVNGGKTKNFYSFATKYCSHHRPSDYPIYDSYVAKMLMYFKRTDKFAKFGSKDLKNYATFKDVLLQFRSFYNLESFNLKQIDKYLWLAGKEYFPNSYGKR